MMMMMMMVMETTTTTTTAMTTTMVVIKIGNHEIMLISTNEIQLMTLLNTTFRSPTHLAIKWRGGIWTQDPLNQSHPSG